MNSEPVDSKDLLQRLIGRWPWLLAAACLGGLVGLGASGCCPPVYEAVAVVGSGSTTDERCRWMVKRCGTPSTGRVRCSWPTRHSRRLGRTKGRTWARRRRTNCATRFDCRRWWRLRNSAFGLKSPGAAARLANAWATASVDALQTAVGHVCARRHESSVEVVHHRLRTPARGDAGAAGRLGMRRSSGGVRPGAGADRDRAGSGSQPRDLALDVVHLAAGGRAAGRASDRIAVDERAGRAAGRHRRRSDCRTRVAIRRAVQ